MKELTIEIQKQENGLYCILVAYDNFNLVEHSRNISTKFDAESVAYRIIVMNKNLFSNLHIN